MTKVLLDTDKAAVIEAVSGATVTDAGTPASDDKVLIQDTSDSDNLKYVNISDLPGGGVDVLSNVDTARIIGRTTAGTGDSEELTAAATRTLLNVEDDADKTDTANVEAAGALMDSEVTNLAQVKAFDSTDYVTPTGTETLTNKRNQPRVSSSASGNITPTKVDFDRYIRTAQAAAITISNPTMDIGEVMAVQLTDNGTARAITFGTHYSGLDGLALPTTTTASKVMTMVLEKVTATKVLVSYVNEA